MWHAGTSRSPAAGRSPIASGSSPASAGPGSTRDTARPAGIAASRSPQETRATTRPATSGTATATDAVAARPTSAPPWSRPGSAKTAWAPTPGTAAARRRNPRPTRPPYSGRTCLLSWPMTRYGHWLTSSCGCSRSSRASQRRETGLGSSPSPNGPVSSGASALRRPRGGVAPQLQLVQHRQRPCQAVPGQRLSQPSRFGTLGISGISARRPGQRLVQSGLYLNAKSPGTGQRAKRILAGQRLVPEMPGIPVRDNGHQRTNRASLCGAVPARSRWIRLSPISASTRRASRPASRPTRSPHAWTGRPRPHAVPRKPAPTWKGNGHD